MAQRNITTKTTIPAPTGAVTVSGVANSKNLLRTAGTGFVTLFGNVFDDRNFIYIATTDELLQVNAIFNDDLIQVSDPLDPTFAGSAAVAAGGEVVFANLESYSFIETTGNTYTVNGVARAANTGVEKTRVSTFSNELPILLPVQVDATGGASLQTEEQRL